MTTRPAFKTEVTLLREFHAVWKEFTERAAAARESGDQSEMDYAGTLAQRLLIVSGEIDNAKRLVVLN